MFNKLVLFKVNKIMFRLKKNENRKRICNCFLFFFKKTTFSILPVLMYAERCFHASDHFVN